MKKTGALFLAALLVFQNCALAQETAQASSFFSTISQKLSSWFGGKYFFGGWNGARQKLSDRGIDVVSTYAADLLTNVTGGVRPHRFRYNSSLGLDINVDLEKTSNLDGLQFHVSGLYRQGKNLAGDIGNRFPPSSIYGNQEVMLYNLYLEQMMFDKRLSLKAGRLGTGDDFAQSPLYWLFLQNAIDGCPISLPINFFFTVYPVATWGARAKYSPVGAFTWKGGVYHQDQRYNRREAHGADFTWRSNKGLLFIQEFSFLPNNYNDAKGLPGNYKLGIFYSTGRFKDQYQDMNGNPYALTGLEQKRRYGNYGMYLHADQMVYKEPGTADQGFTPFVVLVLQPENVNEMPLFVDCGLTYKGLVPGRDRDIAGIGYAYGKWSRDLNKYQNESGQVPQKYEMMIEVTYTIQINDFLYFKPDIQYVINPKGGNQGDARDALVMGARVGVTF